MSRSTPSLIRPSRFFHIIGVLLALLLASLLSGCSAVKLGYNNAPGLSYWWLDSYLDFDDTQSLKVRADLAALQVWHRQNELPVYIDTLKKLQRLAPSSVTPEQLCDISSALKTRFQTLVDQAEPTVVALAPTFKTEQLNHLARQFDKRNQKWRAEWLEGTPTERSARRIKQLTDRIEMLYGKLEEPQFAVLRASGAVSAFDASLSYRETLRRQQDALQTLRQFQPGTWTELQVKAEVRALLVRAMQSPDAAYRNYQEQMTRESCKAFATLHNTATPAQRLQVMETLKDYETDARTLMASKP
jgi:hypothetical protein